MTNKNFKTPEAVRQEIRGADSVGEVTASLYGYMGAWGQRTIRMICRERLQDPRPQAVRSLLLQEAAALDELADIIGEANDMYGADLNPEMAEGKADRLREMAEDPLLLIEDLKDATYEEYGTNTYLDYSCPFMKPGVNKGYCRKCPVPSGVMDHE